MLKVVQFSLSDTCDSMCHRNLFTLIEYQQCSTSNGVQSDTFCCGQHHVTIKSPIGMLIGQINQDMPMCSAPSFYITGPAGEMLFEGQSLTCAYWGMMNDIDFNVLGISKHRSVEL